MPGKSIRIYLADGTPLGIRHAELVNWTGQAIVAPRHRLSELKDWGEVKRPGVYFLFGEEPNTLDDLAYIGESENVFERLKNHASKKDFWRHVAVFTSKDDNLTKSHVKYLEARLVELATEAKRWELDNGNTPQRPSLPRADRDAMEEFIGPLRILLGSLSFNILEPLSASARASTAAAQSAGQEEGSALLEFQVAKHGVVGQGASTDEGFVVFSGSIGSMHEGSSMPKGAKRRRGELMTEHKLKRDGEQFEVLEDTLFTSPSAAASVLGGSSYNGRIVWKDSDGRTLAELEDETLDEDEEDDVDPE